MKSEECATPREGKAFGYLIHDLARLLRRRFDAAAQHHGLTLPQWRVIGQLSLRDGISQSALAGLIDTDPMTVSGLIERLEAKGLVARVPDPSDSRAKTVLLTERAIAMVAEMKQLANEVYGEVFEGVSDADWATSLRVLQQMSANLSKQRAPGKEELV